MAEYIMTILQSQLMVVFSWGFNSPKRLPDDKGLRFNVEGFKYRGVVEVIYNIGSDLFEVHLSDGTKVEDVYLDNLVEVIDSLVEKTPNYEQRVQQEYAL
ncbi:MAG: hypothetical protein IIX32_01935 [Alistipes sp.]|nr:hypothetical protein [Alistipes sp.]